MNMWGHFLPYCTNQGHKIQNENMIFFNLQKNRQTFINSIKYKILLKVKAWGNSHVIFVKMICCYGLAFEMCISFWVIMLRHKFYRTEWSGTKDIMYIGVY